MDDSAIVYDEVIDVQSTMTKQRLFQQILIKRK